MRKRRWTLAVLLAALVVAAPACGGDDDETEGGGGGETATATTGAGNADAGREVFASAGCGSCHTLAAADANGTSAPNLDEVQPDMATVVEQVTNGGGGMPAFDDQLSDQQIQDVAAFVSENAGGS
jgi:mono/diheme cytochrome c family protein